MPRNREKIAEISEVGPVELHVAIVPTRSQHGNNAEVRSSRQESAST
jgi:hypothetical protein